MKNHKEIIYGYKFLKDGIVMDSHASASINGKFTANELLESLQKEAAISAGVGPKDLIFTFMFEL